MSPVRLIKSTGDGILASDEAGRVSRTVRDLTIGSGLELEPCGRHSLEGVPEEWDLYVVR